ncbi:MAG: ABC transporter permease [Spirochaetota bacterium]
MRKLTSLLGQDFVLAWRNGHIAVVIAIAVLMIALVFLLPAQFDTGPGEYVLDRIPGAPVREALVEMDANVEALASTQEEFDAALAENQNALGIVIDGSLEQPRVEVIKRTSVPDQNVSVLIATVDYVLQALARGEVPELPVERIRPQAEMIPVNLMGLPVFLAFEVGILGFLLVAVFVFQEKQEGTIRAYRITPAGLWTYIASKTLVFTILGLSYGTVVVAAALGFAVDWLSILGLVVWASTFMTLFGLGFAVWFNNLSHWFFPGLAVLVLNTLPFFSYVYPVFSPDWIEVIPSYGLIFALREALFPTGDTELVGQTLLTGLAWLGGAGVFAAVSVRSQLLKGD